MLGYIAAAGTQMVSKPAVLATFPSSWFNSAAVLVTPRLVSAVAALATSDRLFAASNAPDVSNAAATHAEPLYTFSALLDVLKYRSPVDRLLDGSELAAP